MSLIKISTNFNIDLEFPAAPFGLRVLAWIIDLVITIIYAIFAYRFLDWIDDTSNAGAWAVYVIVLIPYLTYHLICETFMNGQSIGKKITGIKVVNESGGQPGIGQYTIRWLIRTSDIMIFLFAILLLFQATSGRGGSEIYSLGSVAFCLLIADVILVNSSKKNQRLGDFLAHTLVIRCRQKAAITDTIFLDIDHSYKPLFPQVMQLSDKDINSLKSILDTSIKRKDQRLAEMASDKIKTHLSIITSLTPVEFLQVLLKDYNYLSAN